MGFPSARLMGRTAASRKPIPIPAFPLKGKETSLLRTPRRCRKGLPAFSLVDRRASRNAGADALGCEIKEEASAIGRRRGTFEPKGIRTRRPAISRRGPVTQAEGEGSLNLLQERVGTSV